MKDEELDQMFGAKDCRERPWAMGFARERN